MHLETKGEYFDYIRDLDRMGVAQPAQCHNALIKKFPHLNTETAERLVDLFIKEELENKQNLLLG